MRWTLEVGQTATIRGGFFRKGWTVTYAGMTGPDVYSLVMSWGHGYQSAAYNLYFPVDQREVSFLNGRLVVDGVSPRQARLRFDN